MVRKTVIECILATDMSKHKVNMEKFEDNIGEFHKKEGDLSQAEQNEIAGIYTHICDLSGSAKEFGLAREWSQMVRKEFMKQVSLV